MVNQLYSADGGMAPTGDAPAAPDEKCLTAARAAIDVNATVLSASSVWR